MQEQQNPQNVVSPQQVSDFISMATGGMVNAQPAQQLFQVPASHSQIQSVLPQPQMAPPTQPAQPLNQTPAPQSQPAQVAPPGSARQIEYEKMREDTNKFLHGLIDGAMPYIAKEVVSRMTDEERKTAAEKAVKDEVEKENFFNGKFGNFILGVSGAFIGYGLFTYLSNTFSNDKRECKDGEIAALVDSIETMLA